MYRTHGASHARGAAERSTPLATVEFATVTKVAAIASPLVGTTDGNGDNSGNVRSRAVPLTGKKEKIPWPSPKPF